MWRISFSVALLVTLVASHPQYGPVQTEQAVGGTHQASQVEAGGYPVCDQASDCVPLKICVNGVIDTTGTGSLDLRGGPKKTAEQLGYIICGLSEGSVDVCCKIPVDEYDVGVGGGQIVSGGAVGGGYEGAVAVGGSLGEIHSAISGGGIGVGAGAGHGGVGVGAGAGVGHGGVGVGAGAGAGHGGIGIGAGGGHGVVGAGHGGVVGVGAGHGGVDVGAGVGHGGVGVGAGHGGVGVGAGHGGVGVGAGHGGVGVGAGHGGVAVGGGGYEGSVGVSGGGAVVSGPPYPACSAGLLCVEESLCNLYTGFVGDRIPLFEGQPFIEYKHCTTGVLAVGVCCQEDPARVPVGGDGYVDPAIGGVGVVGGSGGVVGGSGGVVGVGGAGGGYVDPSGVVGVGGSGGVGHAGGVVGVGSSGGVVGVGGGVDGGYVDATGGVVGSGGIVGIGGSGGVVGVGVDGGYVDGPGGVVGSGGVVGIGGSGGVVGIGGSGGVVGVGGSGGVVGSGGIGSGYVDPSTGISSQCGVHEECVLREYCNKGVIVTDGAGFIDLRGKYTYNKCIDPEYPDSDAVCCRPDTVPIPVDTCSNYEVCTDYQFCSPEGFVSETLYSPLYTTGQECYKSKKTSALTGVCCKPSCPVDSVCIPESICFGDVQSAGGSFIPYAPSGSWAQCSLIGQSEPGVCCKNPPPTEPTPTVCGVSQYAQENSLKTRYKTPQITKLEADFGEFPWQAIVFFSNYTFRCGASIITDKHLLTAAHCVRDHHPSDFKIRVGEWQVNTFNEPYPYHDYDVAKITYHPQYRRGAEHNNLVVIELVSPMTLAYNVNTVCLPRDSYTFAPGTRCFVSGWGKDSFVGNYQHILKKVDVPLVEHGYCQTLLRKTRLGRYFRLHKSFLCAGGEEGKDACTGDGGGPLVCLDDNKQYVLVGVTSWGIGCGVKDVPGVYADVSKFVPWVLEAIEGVSGTQYGK